MVFPWIPFLQDEEDDLGSFLSVALFYASTGSAGTINFRYDDTIGDEPQNLQSGGDASSGSPASADFTIDGTSAQVPTGKKWIGYIVYGGASATACKASIRASTTVDTANGTKIWDGSSSDFVTNTVFITAGPLEFSANTFVTLEHESGAGNARFQRIVLYETDA